MTLILIVHIVLSQSKRSLEIKDIKLAKESVSDSSPDLQFLVQRCAPYGFSIRIN